MRMIETLNTMSEVISTSRDLFKDACT